MSIFSEFGIDRRCAGWRDMVIAMITSRCTGTLGFANAAATNRTHRALIDLVELLRFLDWHLLRRYDVLVKVSNIYVGCRAPGTRICRKSYLVTTTRPPSFATVFTPLSNGVGYAPLKSNSDAA